MKKVVDFDIKLLWNFLQIKIIHIHDLHGATGCSGKIVFFHNSMQPLSLAYIAVRDLQSSQLSQCNANVQFLLLAGNFLYNH